MAKSLQDILKRRQQEEFVGREEQLSFFHRNMRWEIDDPRRRFVINISGQGGVGKTWLLRRFRKIVEEFAAVTAYTDEAEDDVPSVMGRIAAQFDAQGYPLKTFAERYKVYRQRQQEIEADPDAPQGFSAFLGRTLAKGGLRLARRVPVGGVAADFVDEEAFASLAGDFASYVARKIGNKDEVRLVLEPVEVLTPVFLADLREVAEKHPIALFLDTYERTGGFLDPWLRDLLEGRHGDVPVNIVLVITGRDELDRNHWAPYEGLLARLPLEPFTEEEAHDYLARKDITDEQVMEVILQLSGRLPLLVATLAAESPDDPAKVGDPSGEAVERFLKWVEDARQRQVALDAALPRRLNRDVLAVLVGEEEASTLFAWLREMPFIEKRGDGWAYHDVVRAQMLRYKRQEAPKGWAELHRRLGEYYESLRNGLGLEDVTGRKHPTWQTYTVEALYHRLCQAPQKYLSDALNGFVAALEAQSSFAQDWAKIVREAGEDFETKSTLEWGERLLNGLSHYQVAAEMFAALTDYPGLESCWHPAMFAWLGEAYRLTGHHEEALASINHALEFNPTYTWALAFRGATYRRMCCYEEALADLNRAIELNPNLVRAVANRGRVYRILKHYEQALADFSRAIELDPNYDFALAGRGETCYLTGRYEEAISDLSKAIELRPDNDWYIYSRALAFLALSHSNEVQIGLTEAISRAHRIYEEKPQEWPNTLNLALYNLAAGKAEETEHLYKETLAGGASLYHIREAIRDLEDLLHVFPDHAQALAMRDLLQEYLQEAQR